MLNIFSRTPQSTAEALAGLSTILKNLDTVRATQNQRSEQLDIEIVQLQAEKTHAVSEAAAAGSVFDKIAALITPDVIAEEAEIAADTTTDTAAGA